MLSEGQDLTLVDVRAPGEYDTQHISRAINIPVADLRTRDTELDPVKAAYPDVLNRPSLQHGGQSTRPEEASRT